jgi:hypothetical protein
MIAVLLAASLAAGPACMDVTPARTGITASADDGNVPGNTVDGDLATRWSADGTPWIQYDLGTSRVVASLKVAVNKGDTRATRFEIQVSDDALTFREVWRGETSRTTTVQETYDIADVAARYVRIVGHGNSTNAWTSLTEVAICASAGTPEPPTPIPVSTPRPSPTRTPTPPPTPAGPRPPRVRLGADGRLSYVPYDNGDTIPDFSTAGYRGGGVALPQVPVRATVAPADGDDGTRIQAAIDAVSALPRGSDGFRGAVLLKAGTYEIADAVKIAASGVVLRGEGRGPKGTLLRATGTKRRTLVAVAGLFDREETPGSRQAITDSYVPVGATRVTVKEPSGFHVGDAVIVARTPNQEWVDAVGTDDCRTKGTAYDTADEDGVTCLSESPWTPRDRVMTYERRIAAVDGNRLTLDAPLVEALQAEFGGGYVVRYTFPGRIEECGVESLRSESDFASDTDEQHATRMVDLTAVQNAWVRDVESSHYEQGTAHVGSGARYVTVQDSASLDHKSQVTGGRRYAFAIDDASFVLVMRCRSETGRHDFVTGSNTSGPNVFLDSVAHRSLSEVGPHHRWATGTLFDRITHESANGKQILGVYNRGNSGTGHGWSGAYQVFWNCVGDVHRVANPPHARNWSVGCRVKEMQGDGEIESLNEPVRPGSLYLQQLEERLGAAALAAIGYDGVPAP